MRKPAVTVNVEPLLELAGEKLAAAPAGNPAALKLTALANPFVAWIVSMSLPLARGLIVRLAVAGESVKPEAAVTVSVIVVDTLVVPDTPVIVIGYLPVGVEGPT